MLRRLPSLVLAALAFALSLAPALAPPAGASPEPSPLTGGILLGTGGSGISLYEPSNGTLTEVADRGNEPAFFPNARAFAYIRAGGCAPTGKGGCYTEYSVFAKSLTDPADEAGRRVFGWRAFFVRSVDIARGGHFVFAAKRGPGPAANGRTTEIWSARLDGTQVRRLTRNRVFDNDVSVSPNGRLVAFSRRVKGRGQIFVMRTDGTHVRRITRDGRRNRLPAWAPNGRRIAYVSQPARHGGWVDRQVYSISIRGTGRRPLTYNERTKGGLIYSPDGRSIAYLAQQGLWMIGAGGALPREVLTAANASGFAGSGIDWADTPPPGS